MLDGICVNTMVLIEADAFGEPAPRPDRKTRSSTLDQKKNTLAADSDRSKRSNSHSASSDCTTKPPAKASRLNSAASL